MKNQTLRTLAQIAVATSLATVSFAASAVQTSTDGNVVVKVGKAITLTGEPIENATIVIEGGRVTAVGTDIKYPWNAEVREYPDAVAFPGFIEALTNKGMDRANENIDVAAFLNVKDSIDPVKFYFADALRAGITTINVQQGKDCVIGGRGYVVKPSGMTIEQMTVYPNYGVAMSAVPKSRKTRATQALALRHAFSGLRMYLEGVVQEKVDGKDFATREALYQGREPDKETIKGRPMGGDSWKVENMKLVPRWELDEKQAPLLAIVEGKIPVYLYCQAPADVHTAINVAKDNGFLKQTTLVLGGACWKAADQIAKHKLPVILTGSIMHTDRDPITGDEVKTFVPGVFAKKGIVFALQSAGASAESLWYQAALCVGAGMPREQAIAAVTTVPAKMLGLEKRVGQIATGADGNLVIFSGDPLKMTSHVINVFLEGNEVYDRATDVRMTHLTTGAQPAGTASVAEMNEEVHKHEDPVIEETKKVDAGEEIGEEEPADKGDDDHDDHDHHEGDGHDHGKKKGN